MKLTGFFPWLFSALLAVLVSACGDSEKDANTFESSELFASMGLADSQFNLGCCYLQGVGVAKNPAEAVKWYRKAADQGYAPAQNHLGILYGDGVGVAKDQVEAYAYLNLASIVEEVSRKWRDDLEDKMTPEAVLRGQQRTKELQKEIDAKIEAKRAEYFKKAKDEKKAGK